MRCSNCNAVHTDIEVETEDGFCPSCGYPMIAIDSGFEDDLIDDFQDDDNDEDNFDVDFLSNDIFDDAEFDSDEFDDDEAFDFDDEEEIDD
jgi:hypothetical protein